MCFSTSTESRKDEFAAKNSVEIGFKRSLVMNCIRDLFDLNEDSGLDGIELALHFSDLR